MTSLPTSLNLQRVFRSFSSISISSGVFHLQNGGTTVIVERMLDFSLEDEGLFNSDDDDIPFLAAVATYMRRHLPRNRVTAEYPGTRTNFCVAGYAVHGTQ